MSDVEIAGTNDEEAVREPELRVDTSIIERPKMPLVTISWVTTISRNLTYFTGGIFAVMSQKNLEFRSTASWPHICSRLGAFNLGCNAL